jgi:multiple sugar transport system permease protein
MGTAVATGRRRTLARRRTLTFYLFIAPWLIGFLVFQLGPILASLYFSFNKFTIVRPPVWVGLRNYVEMFTADRLFWISLYNTAFYTFGAVPTGLALALAVAVLLNQRLPGLAAFRTLYYLPSVTPAVANSILWLWLFDYDNGLINGAVGFFGLRGPAWLADPDWAKPAFIVMHLWGVGTAMVIFLAGLQNIPPELYEAAELDGAGRWMKFRHVTIPILSPVIFFNLVMSVIGSFQVFTAAYVMTNGGPLDATRFYLLVIFENAFGAFNMGYASAMAWVLFVLVLAITLVQFKILGTRVHYEAGTREG